MNEQDKKDPNRKKSINLDDLPAIPVQKKTAKPKKPEFEPLEVETKRHQPKGDYGISAKCSECLVVLKLALGLKKMEDVENDIQKSENQQNN